MSRHLNSTKEALTGAQLETHKRRNKFHLQTGTCQGMHLHERVQRLLLHRGAGGPLHRLLLRRLLLPLLLLLLLLLLRGQVRLAGRLRLGQLHGHR
jgi:hypothetical protein